MYLEPCETSKMKHLVEIVTGFSPLTIFAKKFLLNVCKGSEYTSTHRTRFCVLQLTIIESETASKAQTYT